ncbi:hypothetical protein DET54_104332 [Paenibacillus pabuli]|uniref:Uncharacterized protein n=1 Tax=Paenibacillus pabuli TaxID=1472 RepID=A0A855Y0W7_9BACL|nr:hypothetical protein DET56_11572 [Paenibacillus pabuli]PXW00781.1 hypothetical protein DEU73_11472 [Paenibacillus taichungensis]RAI98275.1 hypothetical protein DET54_104332 [Paenibacillus pabuli]
MTETTGKEPYKILLRASLTLTSFLFIGLVFIWIFKQGDMLPFIADLFIPNEISVLSAVLIGLISSFVITTIAKSGSFIKRD